MKYGLLLFAALIVSPIARAEASCVSPSNDQLIKLEGHPFAVEPTSDNCHLFVSFQTPKSGMVAVLVNDGGKFRLVRTFNTSMKVGGRMDLSHDGRLLAVAGYDKVTLFDANALIEGRSNPQIASFEDGGRAAISAQFSYSDANLFVSEEQNATILVLSVPKMVEGNRKQAIIGRIPVANGPVGLALSPDGGHLFATAETMGGAGPCVESGGGSHAEGALFEIDARKAIADPPGSVLTGIEAGCDPVRVVVSADGHSLWVSERGSNRVLGIDPTVLLSSGSHPQTLIDVGKSPIGLAIRRDGSQLWVANSDRFDSREGSITVIAPAAVASAQIYGTYEVGHFPRDIRFMPDGKTLVLALFADDEIGVHVAPEGTSSSDQVHKPL